MVFDKVIMSNYNTYEKLANATVVGNFVNCYKYPQPPIYYYNIPYSYSFFSSLYRAPPYLSDSSIMTSNAYTPVQESHNPKHFFYKAISPCNSNLLIEPSPHKEDPSTLDLPTIPSMESLSSDQKEASNTSDVEKSVTFIGRKRQKAFSPKRETLHTNKVRSKLRAPFSIEKIDKVDLQSQIKSINEISLLAEEGAILELDGEYDEKLFFMKQHFQKTYVTKDRGVIPLDLKDGRHSSCTAASIGPMDNTNKSTEHIKKIWAPYEDQKDCQVQTNYLVYNYLKESKKVWPKKEFYYSEEAALELLLQYNYCFQICLEKIAKSDCDLKILLNSKFFI